MEEAVQGSHPYLHRAPLLRLAAAIGNIPLAELFVQPQNPSHEDGRAHQHPGPGWYLKAQAHCSPMRWQSHQSSTSQPRAISYKTGRRV